MIKSFVLISAASDLRSKVFRRLDEIEEIMEIHPLFGEYSFIVRVECETNERLGEIMDTIRNTRGILATKTLLSP